MKEEKDVLVVERRGSAAIVTLNLPQRMNAFSRSLVDALLAVLESLGYDPEVRTIILTGAGERAFCAGADLKERREMNDLQVKRFVAKLQRLMDLVEELPKPVIAAVNGFALGGGLELALACDLRVAADEAKLGLTEVRLAIIPGAGGTQRLPRIVGLAKAKEMIFTGRRVDGKEAERIGLVHRSVPRAELLDAALAYADEMALAGPIALRQAKFAIDQGMRVDLRTGLAIERKAYELVIDTEDRLEALAAFAEKRTPEFKGH